jgi:high-affinity Fe2+/Pb2+ permease
VSLYVAPRSAYSVQVKTIILNWRRTAMVAGIVAFVLTGRIVSATPGSSGLAFFVWFMVVSTAIVAALTLWLVPRSHKSD